MMGRMELVEFLLARIGDDEEAARAAGDEMWQVIASDVHLTGGNANHAVAVGPYGAPIGPAAIHIVRHQPANVLAECRARRRIVDRYLQGESLRDLHPTAALAADIRADVLADLAAPYSGHPDYQPEWAPETTSGASP